MMFLIPLLCLPAAFVSDESEGGLRRSAEMTREQTRELLSTLNVREDDLAPLSTVSKVKLTRIGLSTLLFIYRRKQILYGIYDATEWARFWTYVLYKYGPREAAAILASQADGPIPVMDLIAAGMTIWSIIDIIQAWDEIWDLVLHDEIVLEG